MEEPKSRCRREGSVKVNHHHRKREKERNRDREKHKSKRRHDDDDQRPRNKAKIRENDDKEKETKKERERRLEKRRRGVEEWQDLRRKKKNEESEKVKLVTREPQSGKSWTLEGESDDEEAGGMSIQSAVDHGEEINSLDAYMNSTVLPQVEKLNSIVPPDSSNHSDSDSDSDSDSGYGEVKDEEVPWEEDDEEFMKRVKKTKVEKLPIVDHSKIDYPSFRKNFYSEVKEISRMTSDEVVAHRKQLELKIHGKNVPKPVKS